MIMKVFAIYDTKGLCYGAPFFRHTVGAAVRDFGDLAADKQSSISKHPKDYILFEIGGFDDQTAKLLPMAVVNNLGLASDYVGCDRQEQLPLPLEVQK